MVTIPPTPTLPPPLPATVPPVAVPNASTPVLATSASSAPLPATVPSAAQPSVVVATPSVARQPQSLPGILFPLPTVAPPPPPPVPQTPVPTSSVAPPATPVAQAQALVQATIADLPLPAGSTSTAIPGTPKPLVLANGAVPAPAPVVKAPGWAAALPTGAQVPGIVLSRSTEGLALVRTALGPIAVSTDLPVQPGTPVTLQVQATGPTATVQILGPRQPIVMPQGAPPLPGQSLAATVIQVPQVTGQPVQQAAQTYANPLLAAQLAAGVEAEGAAPIPFGLSAPGDRVSLKVVTVSQPAVANPAQPQGATAGAAGILANAAAAARSALANASGLASPLLGTAAPSAAGGGGPTLTAQVVGATVANQPVVLAGGSLLALETSPLPVGTAVTLQPLARLPSAGSAPLPRGTESLLAGLSQLATQADQLPVAAQTALIAALPKPGPRLAAEMMHFVSALRTGQVANWLGEGMKLELEKAGRGRAAKVLSDDFAQASRDVSTQATDWRAFTIPLSHQQVVQPVRLYLHKPSEDDTSGRDRSGDGTRFVVDLDLSALGPIQLDGFSKPPRLDIVVRTPAALPEALRHDMLKMFVEATQARGVVGGLSFQVAARINPMAPKAYERPGLMV